VVTRNISGARDKYKGQPLIKLGLTKINYADFRQEAEENISDQIPEITVYELLSEYAEGDSVDMEVLRLQADELNQEMRKNALIEEEHRLASEDAQLSKRKS